MPPRDTSLIEERKLAPVYEDIQNERYKPALATLDRYLKKSPNSSLAHILRSYVLLKIGRPQAEVLSTWKKGVAAAENVSGGDIGSRGLWWSGIIMRDLQRWDILLDLYERMWANQPDNTVLGEQILLISAAAWDTPKMVASSRKMFNLTKAPTWARVAAWAEWADKSQPLPKPSTQPFPSPSPTSAPLKIAQILLSTTRKAVPSADVLWLHLQILLAADDVKGALELAKAEGYPGGGVGRTHWRMEAVREILRRYGEKGDEGREMASEVGRGEVRDFGALLAQESDMQRNYANYIYLTHCATISSSSSDLEAVRHIFEKLQTAIGAKERSPALALLDLDAKSPEADRMSREAWAAAVDTYYTRWGAKGVVVPDLLSIVGRRQEEISCLMKKWRAVEGDFETLEQYMLVKHATLLNPRLDSWWSASQVEFGRLWKLYQAGLPFGANLPDTDVQPADELGIAAVQVLLLLSRQVPSTAEDNATKRQNAPEQLLLQAITCLRYMLSHSPACASAKFALVRLYRLIGAPGLMAKPLESLKLAEIQLDTLLHVVSERGGADAEAGQVGRVLEEVLDRASVTYARSASSLSESIKTAIEHESYASIAPIRELSHTLSHSVGGAITLIEQTRLSLLRADPGQRDVADIDIQQLSTVAGRGKEDWVDVRNWELFPAHVGLLADDGREEDPEKVGARMLALCRGERATEGQKVGKEVDGEWCSAWADVFCRIASVGESRANEGAAQVRNRGLPVTATIAEKAALTILRDVLSKLEGRSSEAGSSVTDAITQLVSSASSPGRWTAIHGISLLLGVRSLLFTAQSKVNQGKTAASASSATKSGKKVQVIGSKAPNGAGSSKSTISGEAYLGEILEKLAGAIQGVSAELSSMIEAEKEWAAGEDGVWSSEVLGMGPDDDFVRDTIDEIRSARMATLSKLQYMCDSAVVGQA